MKTGGTIVFKDDEDTRIWHLADWENDSTVDEMI
jgi:hypothetical protein